MAQLYLSTYYRTFTVHAFIPSFAITEQEKSGITLSSKHVWNDNFYGRKRCSFSDTNRSHTFFSHLSQGSGLDLEQTQGVQDDKKSLNNQILQLNKCFKEWILHYGMIKIVKLKVNPSDKKYHELYKNI